MKTLYTSSGCPNCVIAKEYIAEHNLDIEIVHIDPQTRTGRDIQMQYRVMGVPTLITEENGKEVARQVGVIDFSKL